MTEFDALLNALSADARPVLISGPTASGKSALALRLAEQLGGAVLNADALQVYADWRVLTARPTPADEARAPHALYGHVDAATQDYSVGRWLRDASALLDADGPRPLIVGGPSLYFNALTRGLAEIPPIDPSVRIEGERRLTDGGAATLLRDLDAATRATIDAANPRRVLRAWEVLRGTGRGLADWAAETPPPRLPLANAHAIKLDVDVPTLDDRIRRRFAAMVADGALDEARAVAVRGLDPSLPAMRAVGAPELFAHLRGETRLAQAVDAAALATRRLAKRQRTWMRNQMSDWTVLRAPV